MCHKNQVQIFCQVEISWSCCQRDLICVTLYKTSCYQWSVINSLLKLLNCMPLLIPSGGLKVPLMSLFSCSDELIINTLKDFVEAFYTYDFTGLVAVSAATKRVILKSILASKNLQKSLLMTHL